MIPDIISKLTSEPLIIPCSVYEYLNQILEKFSTHLVDCLLHEEQRVERFPCTDNGPLVLVLCGAWRVGNPADT